MKPYTTLKKGMQVTVVRKTHTNLSQITDKQIGNRYTIMNFDYDGRQHNKYIAYVYLRDKDGLDIRAAIDELATMNPNFEPTGEFIVCVGCGATVQESNLKILKSIELKACPKCNMLKPTES